MVAVISGDGLGLLGTSLQQLGVGLGGKAGLGQSGASQYVNIATGNLVLQGQDERLVEQGFLAGVLRTYNSLGSTGDLGGAGGWLLGLDRKLGPVTGTLNTAGSTITRIGSDGEEEVFTYDVTRGAYVASNKSGAEDILRHSAWLGSWSFIAGGSRSEEIYDGNGRLDELRDNKTGATYELTYDTAGRLMSVMANPGTGESLELGYDAQGRIATLSTVQMPAGGGGSCQFFCV
jgi:YD repeat-containing protein